jgi:flagellar hook protein FlgE
MGITSSLITGLSGLTSNQSKLDVIGNNIANVNTVGFKSSRLDFKTQFSQSFSYGSAPTSELGGTNPLQIGMGVVQGAVSRNFNDGSREVTGVSSNLAIEGDGFFILKDGSSQTYTRDGTFKLNSNDQLVNSDGLHVQGFGIDAGYNIIPGVLEDITIPIGTLTVADATSSVTMGGNLNTNGALPTAVSDLTLNQELYTSDGAGGVTGTAPTSDTALTLLTDDTGVPYFQDGDTLTFTGTVGSRSVNAKTLSVTSTTTLGDLMSFMNGTLGIDTTAGANGTLATTPGVSLDTGAAGAAVLTIDGNLGSANDLTLNANSLSISRAGSSTSPFTWDKNATADGESTATTAVVYDSLGTEVTLNVVTSLISRDATGATWRFYATSPDGTGTGALTQGAVGTGTLTFDTNGTLIASTDTTATIDRNGTGATPNLTFDLNFNDISGLTDTTSEVYTTIQDGQPMGTLTSYSIDQNGIIKGTFDNGLNRTLGQVAMATFRNNQGLVDLGNNAFQEGPNSGTAVISAPGDLAAGTIVSGALELSNVDLSSEFVQLISASTGFSASSRVITTSNQLMQELLAAAR